METKRCSKCGEEKTFDGFYTDRTKRDGKSPSCKECHTAYHREWRRQNPLLAYEKGRKSRDRHSERNREMQRRWREKNADTLHKKKKAYYEANIDAKRSCDQKYGETHREQIREYHKRYYAANGERVRRHVRLYCRANAENLNHQRRERRARRSEQQRIRDRFRDVAKKRSRIQAPGQCSPEKIIQRMELWGSRCWLCGDPYQQVDHVKPLSRGGSRWPSNLRPVCRLCNLRKHAKWPFDRKELLREVELQQSKSLSGMPLEI